MNIILFLHMITMLTLDIFTFTPAMMTPVYEIETVSVEMEYISVDMSTIQSSEDLEGELHQLYQSLTLDQMVEREFEPERMMKVVHEPINLTDDEKYLCGRIIATEAGYDNAISQVLVAQTIYNRMNENNLTISEATQGQYAVVKSELNDQIIDIVEMVFSEGRGVTDEDVRWFYNPALCTSSFHESKKFVIEVGGHRYFATE